LEAVVETIEGMWQRPPDEVLPAVARVAARSLAGRAGIVRTLLFEATSLSEESGEAVRYLLTRGIGTLLRYVAEQMEAGRLRRMHPLLAVQSFAGPMLFHLVTRRLAERELGLDVPFEEVAVEMASL